MGYLKRFSIKNSSILNAGGGRRDGLAWDRTLNGLSLSLLKLRLNAPLLNLLLQGI